MGPPSKFHDDRGILAPIAPRTYYAHISRPPSKRTLWDTVVTELLAGVYEPDQQGRRPPESLYGAVKIWAYLHRQGVPVARSTIERIMRANGWRGIARGRARPVTTVADPAHPRADDLVKRQFKVGRPNALWVADFTYVPLAAGGFVYTALVIDAFAGYIVGWECSVTKHTVLVEGFVQAAIRQAVALRARQGHPLQDGPGSTVHHSDAGSQARLPGLIVSSGVHTFDLDVLRPDEALDLVAAILGIDPAGSNAEVLAALADRCAYLPLALRIAAANHRVRPRETLSGIVQELASDRLSALAFDKDPRQGAVRTAFDLSYRELNYEQRRTFCWLGIVDGPDCSDAAIAALLARPIDTTRRLLRSLVSANLVEQPAAHRFGLHDLLRDYARKRAESEELIQERHASIVRLLTWLLDTAQDAARLINPHRRVAPQTASMTDLRRALYWYEEEHETIMAAGRQASSLVLRRLTWELADAMFDFLDLRAYTQDNLEIHRLGYQAATLAGNQFAAAVMLRHIAVIYRQQGQNMDAVSFGEEALQRFRELGDSWAEAESMATLASIHWKRSGYKQVDRLIGAALTIRQRIGDRMGEAECLHDLASLHRRLGNCYHALHHDLEALDVQQELEDRRGEARSFLNLSRVYCRMGLRQWAMREAQQSLMIHQELGDQYGQALALCSIANIMRHQGNLAKALQYAEEALHIQQRLPDSRGEAATRDNIARIELAFGRIPKALAHTHRALDIDQQLSDPYGKAQRIHTQGLIKAAEGHWEPALQSFNEELELRHRVGDVRGTATTYIAMAEVYARLGRPAPAVSYADLAVQIERKFDNPFAIGRRLLAAGAIARGLLGEVAARSYFTEARTLLDDFQENLIGLDAESPNNAA